MKLAFATIALSVAATLTACQTVVPTSTTSAVKATNVKKDAELNTILAAHTWAYSVASSQAPIVLRFADQHLSVNTGCNTIFGQAEVKGDQLVVGNLASTMKMCSPELMQQEAFASALFKGNLSLTVDQTQPTKPVLTVQTTTGQSYQFIGTQTPETKYQSQGETIFLEVSPEVKDCTGVAPQKCLQVREIKYDDKGLKTSVGDWQLFYSNIDGFEHNPEYRTVLRLKRYTIANPAADQSKYAYVHDMTVESEIIR